MYISERPTCTHRDTSRMIWVKRIRKDGSPYSVRVPAARPCGSPALVSKPGGVHLCPQHLRS